jgi:hypothetical protein
VSIYALLKAARDDLRSRVPLIEAECEVMPDGRPEPKMGRVFAAVHDNGNWWNSSKENLDEMIGFDVTITLKVDTPSDRTGEHRIAKASTGLLALAEKAVIVLHSSYLCMDQANLYLAADGTLGESFVEPPRFSRGSKIQQRGGDWYGAVNEERRPACLTVQLSFRDARRLRGLNNLKGASW